VTEQKEGLRRNRKGGDSGMANKVFILVCPTTKKHATQNRMKRGSDSGSKKKGMTGKISIRKTKKLYGQVRNQERSQRRESFRWGRSTFARGKAEGFRDR